MNIRRRIMLLVSVVAIWMTVFAAAEETEYPTGISGEAVWTLKGDTMYITGQGILSGPANADCHPWEYFEDQIRHVVVEDGVTLIGDLAFAHTHQLETVTIADSVTEICEGAFRNCYGLKTVKFPARLETLGNFAFAYCEKLESAELPDSLTQMGGSVFTGCSSMTRVKLPDDLYDVQQMNFDACMSLTEVTIPAGVGFLRHASFPNCFNLKKVVFEGKQPNTNGDPFYMCPEDLVVYCYSDAEGWEDALFYTYPVVRLDRATGLPVTEDGGDNKADNKENNSYSGGNTQENEEEVPLAPPQNPEPTPTPPDPPVKPQEPVVNPPEAPEKPTDTATDNIEEGGGKMPEIHEKENDSGEKEQVKPMIPPDAVPQDPNVTTQAPTAPEIPTTETAEDLPAQAEDMAADGAQMEEKSDKETPLSAIAGLGIAIAACCIAALLLGKNRKKR